MRKNLKRILASLLVVVMLLGVAPMANIGGTAIKASATSKTADEAMSWCEAKLGSKVGTGQCVALIQAYYQYLGYSAVSGNGCDYATNSVPSGWSRVYQGVPQKGDILVYTGAKYGHVAIYAGGTTSYHQNMAGLYVEKKTNWSYNKSWYSNAEGGTKSYWGYIRPNFSGGTPSNNPNGCVDSVWGGAGFVHVSGWAFDADDMAAQLNIHVYIGDEGHGWLYANKERTDVNNVYGCGNYHGFDENIQTDKTGEQTVSIYAINVGGGANILLHQTTVNISPAPTYSLDINTVIDGTTYMSGKSGFTFDLYLNGSLVADDAIDYANVVRGGTTYEVKDIRCPNGFAYAGGTYSGTVNENTDIRPTFSSNLYSLDVNGILDGVSEGWLSNYGTCDVYINGTMVANDVSDYCKMHAYGSKYEIKDIKASTGITYNGISSGTLSGTIDNNKAVVLNFSRTAYKLYFDVNHDGVRTNYYKPTKSSKTVNGVNYSYDLSNNIMTLNGTLTESGIVDCYEFTTAKDTSYKVTATVLSGSISNGTFVIEACQNDGNGVSGRLYLDVFSSNTSKTWTFTSTTASEVKRIHTWLWKRTGTTTFSNLKIKVKIEKLPSSTSSGTEFSPCMRGMHYNESYGTLMTPTRTGYTFEGWYTSATGGTKITSASKYPATNQTLYAHWTCNHSYTSQIVTAATCCSTGTKKYTCKTCGNTYTETIAKNANNHTGGTELKNVKSATCGEAGYTGDTYCKGCSVVITKGSTIPATGNHSYISSIAKQATCNSTGTIKYICTACGYTYDKITEKNPNNHNGGMFLRGKVSATCAKEGYTGDNCCQGCSAVLIRGSVVPPTGNHSFGEWKLILAPTCTTTGEKARICSVCGKAETLAVDTIAHSYDEIVTEATCTEDGEAIYICSCGDTYSEVIPAKGHHDEYKDGMCDACGLKMSDKPTVCSCNCHKSGFFGFIWKFINFFNKLFKTNPVCSCGVKHY
ncbi:MAG: InlB B-repeat-containing protein [Acutalibacteraceae bacterium]